MPSKKTRAKTLSGVKKTETFLPILLLTFLLWIFYRSIFHFPVWFDESIGKLIFFALPSLGYIAISHDTRILATFAFKKMKSGLLMGLAIGGLFGFVAALLGSLSRNGQVEFVPYYLADWFWLELFLALLTGFWETLFFFSFVMQAIEEKFSAWSLQKQIFTVALIFLLFHLPNILLRFDMQSVFLQILLLFTFALGQALLFYRQRNAYLLLMVQAIWGMALLIHF